MIICTMTTASHMFRAKVLAQSVKEHHPEATFILGYMEKNWKHRVKNFSYFDHCILAKDMMGNGFNSWMFKRRVHEASYGFKGHFLKFLFQAFPQENEIIFLDSDMYVLEPLHEVLQALRQKPIVLTPHMLTYTDLSFLYHGIYNIGFLALRRSSETDRFLEWWTERNDQFCFETETRNGIYYEQNCLNLAPLYFDIHSLRHPGYNVAFWNLKERSNIQRADNGRYLIEGVPLILFHFSNLESGLKRIMDQHVGKHRRAMYILRSTYMKKLLRMGTKKDTKMRWSYDYYNNKTRISLLARNRYKRDSYLQAKGINPFSYSNRRMIRATGISRKEHLRIVQVVSNYPNALPLPPSNQGGTEKIVHELTEELVRRGHKVTLYAARGSRSSAKVIELPANIRDVNIRRFVLRTIPKGVDIIHDHTFRSSIDSIRNRIPTLSTRHLPSRHRALHAVFVSKRAKHVIGKKRGYVVYNGINPNEYQFSQLKQNFMLFMGRILGSKGVLEAMDVADRTGLKLVIAGPIKDQRLYEDHMIPRMKANPNIDYAGAVGGQEKQNLLKHARCLLFPIQWEEPFGLVMVEAMACGTPVLAFNKGSVPEVLAGFPQLICHSTAEMVDKVRNADFPQPQDLRNYVLERFTTSRMVDRYLQVYRDLIRKRRRRLERKTAKKPIMRIRHNKYMKRRKWSLKR